MVWAQVDATLPCPLPSPTPGTGYNTLGNVLLQVCGPWPSSSLWKLKESEFVV